MTLNTATKTAPGSHLSTPHMLWIVLTSPKFDALELAKFNHTTFGAVSHHQYGPMGFWQIDDPQMVHAILVEHANQFHKGQVMKRAFRPLVGDGLLTSDGEFWKRQRKLAQPAFHVRRIEAYSVVMAAFAERLVSSWRSGQTIRVDAEMSKLTLEVVCKTLFDADVSGDAERVGQVMVELLELSNQLLGSLFTAPDWLPTPFKRKFARLIGEMEAILQRIINERRRTNEDKGDLLSMLMAARDENDQPMSDQQLRDETMTLFIAGHETTAMLLTWTVYLLAQHPAVAAKLRAEVDAVLGGRSVTLADLPHLPYHEQVLKETLRLYPVASGVNREPIADTTINGYCLKRGEQISINFYVMHRNPDIFPDPERFDPDRFAPEREAQIPRYAYLPFGAGPRICIGNNFALMEAKLVLATVMQRVELALAADQNVKLEQIVTLRPADGLFMRVQPRTPAAALA